MEEKQEGVVIERYIVQITRYPGGKTFPKIFPISSGIKAANSTPKKKKPKKELKQVNLDSEEIY